MHLRQPHEPGDMLHDSWQTYLQNATPPAAGPPVPGSLCYLPELGQVLCTGRDVLSFLQGYLTCDVPSLTAERHTPFALCNLKGRVVVNGWAGLAANSGAAEAPAVQLTVHVSLAPRIGEFLQKYLVFSKTRLADVSADTLVFGGFGAGAPGAPIGARGDTARSLATATDLERAKRLWAAGTPTAATVWWSSFVRDHLVLVTAATSEAFLPQMLGLEAHGAVSFDKGCYLGQEVVARAQHRGAVKRSLHRLAWRGSRPAIGAEVTRAGSGAGTVVWVTEDGECLAVLGRDGEGPLASNDAVLEIVD